MCEEKIFLKIALVAWGYIPEPPLSHNDIMHEFIKLRQLRTNLSDC